MSRLARCADANRWRRLAGQAGVATLGLALCGCEKAMQNMYNQPKYKPMAASTLWEDGQSARPGVPGTIAHSAGVLAGTSSGRLGAQPLPVRTGPVYPLDARGEIKAQLAPESARPLRTRNPLPLTAATLERGQERFNIYCSPCHSEAGDGDGMVVRRGFPHPPSYHSERLRNAPDAHFFNVITNGYGVMFSYADRIEPDDRWAIVAYIRALQLSQHARLQDVPQPQRNRLGEAVR